MNLDKLNGWLAVLTNIAMVLGLLLVAYEVRQNDEVIDSEATLLRTAIGDSGSTGFRDLNSSIATDPAVAEIWLKGNNGELTTELELLRYEKLGDIWITNWETIWFGWEANRQGTGSVVLDMVKLEAEGKLGLISTIQRRSRYRPNIEFYIQLNEWGKSAKN